MGVVFKTRVKVWKATVKGKVYNRYVIEIPRAVGEVLDTSKKYLVTLQEDGQNDKSN